MFCSRRLHVRYPYTRPVHCTYTSTEGKYHTPKNLPADAADLISRMLAIDPVTRITVPEITRHPFFLKDVPQYLKPLPPPPAVVGTLSSLVAPPVSVDFELIEGLGRIDEDVVEDLAVRLTDMTKEDIWEALRRDDGPQGNTMKVAYSLLRDKRRVGKDCKSITLHFLLGNCSLCVVAHFEEQEREAQIAAMDVGSLFPPIFASWLTESYL